MSGYVLELLRDCSLYDCEDYEIGSPLHIAHLDFLQTTQTLLDKQILDERHILVLALFFQGDKRAELQQVDGWKELLSFALKQLEVYTEYTDENFIERALQKRTNLKTIRLALVRTLNEYGENFELA